MGDRATPSVHGLLQGHEAGRPLPQCVLLFTLEASSRWTSTGLRYLQKETKDRAREHRLARGHAREHRLARGCAREHRLAEEVLALCSSQPMTSPGLEGCSYASEPRPQSIQLLMETSHGFLFFF